jgi:hypothetical protein
VTAAVPGWTQNEAVAAFVADVLAVGRALGAAVDVPMFAL